MAAPVFALADANNFYASCERVFQPRLEGPPGRRALEQRRLRHRPQRRGQGARLRDGRSVPPQPRETHRATTSPSSVQQLRALRRHEPPRHGHAGRVHPRGRDLFSIDEAFLNLAGFERRGLTDYARLIRATVRRDTGIPVSIGIGPTKTLAKIANHLAKAEPETGGVLRPRRSGRG